MKRNYITVTPFHWGLSGFFIRKAPIDIDRLFQEQMKDFRNLL